MVDDLPQMSPAANCLEIYVRSTCGCVRANLPRKILQSAVAFPIRLVLNYVRACRQWDGMQGRVNTCLNHVHVRAVRGLNAERRLLHVRQRFLCCVYAKWKALSGRPSNWGHGARLGFSQVIFRLFVACCCSVKYMSNLYTVFSLPFCDRRCYDFSNTVSRKPSEQMTDKKLRGCDEYDLSK